MFTAKKTNLFPVEEKQQKTSGNAFVQAGLKRSAITRTGNGAVAYSTTGDDFVDQFGKISLMKAERTYDVISKDMSVLWAKNPETTIKFTLYIRMITRTVQYPDGSKTEAVQRGAGLKHEALMRMIWLHINHEDAFYENLALFIAVGSWRDVFEMLRYDLEYNGWEGRQLNWEKIGEFILAGIINENTHHLIMKYLPQIKARSACSTVETQANNMIAKWICSLLFGAVPDKNSGSTYKQYRKLKSSGLAHVWQQQISKRLLNEIDFDTIHGRALSLLVGSKFLQNNNLEGKYDAWIASKPIAKYTGFVHELFAPIGKGWGNMKINSLKKYQVATINAQFNSLVETGKKGINQATSFIVVRDTSSSMTSDAVGTKMSSYCIGKSLALYFSALLPKGAFADTWIEFNNKATLHQWKGSTPVEKFLNDKTESYGSTNFLGVIDLFISLKNKGVAESEFPTGILCLSDCQFNQNPDGTTVNAALKRLKEAGFSQEYTDNFKIVLWIIPNGYYHGSTPKITFETYGNTKNVYYFSGYDGSVVAFLTGIAGKEGKAPSTALELFNAAMDQEVLSLVTI